MGVKRGRPTAIHALLSCLSLVGSVFASPESQRLAVVVPAHAGDLPRAVSALDRWPKTCSPITKESVDLVLYYGEGEDDPEPLVALDAIASTAGRCFGNTKLVYANLTPEEDVYPKGPSVQFYKMFMDEDVKASLSEYDALAIIEWDVLVASDRSFAELHRAAFHNAEDFWVKGSNIVGTNFHTTVAGSSDMWHVMGHINGNAIYNNNDPMFKEFVEYTLARWDYKYPYDVALWATISDFPYSWPLWQRFSSKFVTTNLISNVGYEHVDSRSVSDAVAGETLFIHGSSVDNGSLAVLKATSASATGGSGIAGSLSCREACGSDDAASGLVYGTSTVCDPTCTASGARFGGYLCGAGESEKFGGMCRMCYTDVEEARKAETELAAGLHVIMCDTKRPPAAAECSDECSLKKDTVCDEACGTGIHGDYNCDWRGLGSKCRFCFHDVETALAADEVAKRHGGRAVMCDTHEPPLATAIAIDVAAPVATMPRRLTAEEVPRWKQNQKWKETEKWKGDEENGILPKWKTNQKWKKNRCDEGCVRTSNNGQKGRVCDKSCDGGDPYGRLGCGAKNNMYGRYCRTCFNDVALAMAADTPEHRAIMCDTVEPVSAYRGSRKLLSVEAPVEEQEEPIETAAAGGDGETDFESFMRLSADKAFTEDVKRGEICAFIEGHADRVLQTGVSVESILEFVPGVRVAVAAEPGSLAEYERQFGFYSTVRVTPTPNAHLSSLFADEHCGEGTKLILYMQAGSVLSRAFTSKDTHTPRGELLVVYGDARRSFRDAEIAGETAAVLGFDAPSFTYGTDLMLPFGANAELRAELEEVALSQDKLDAIPSVPQILAAHAYAQDTEGVHFVDPQAWVTQNLFKATSVWDIPLMKPRFACTIPNPTILNEDEVRADALERSLELFRMGGSCEDGILGGPDFPQQ